MSDFDVIIIGSGIGGLMSGGILTSKGLKTLIVEGNRTAGGYLSSFKRNGFVFDSTVDCVSGVNQDGLIFKVLKLLDVHNDIALIELDPIRGSIFPDIEISVDRDINAYVRKLVRLFPSEGAAVRGFFKKISMIYDVLQAEIDAFISGAPPPGRITLDMLRLRDLPYNKLLDDFFSDYRLKAVLSDRCHYIGLPPSMVSSLAMITIIMSYFRLGAQRIQGGFQRLSDAFVKGIRNQGGTVVLGNGVKRIIMKGDGCCGVQCDSGDEYTSKYVISNADFNLTFSSLLGGRLSHIAEEMNDDHGISTSFFIVYAGVKGELKAYSNFGYYPSYDIEGLFTHDTSFNEDSHLGFAIASNEDKTRAPDGHHTMVFYELVESSRERLDKSRCTEIVLTKAVKILPDIKDRIVVLDSATPHTLERYTKNLNGAAFGWRQIAGLRSVPKHGIHNLYIAGHWGDMGGGVLAAAYSGAKAALDILSKEGVEIGI
ncbi:MAG: NAD(P)/FAD-dependent oxidoreductase [Planctomycetes bacterium]|nr:NAD(P)/FAD-dependent oxidoreductase [Planctomycetota bacterium]